MFHITERFFLKLQLISGEFVSFTLHTGFDFFSVCPSVYLLDRMLCYEKDIVYSKYIDINKERFSAFSGL